MSTFWLFFPLFWCKTLFHSSFLVLHPRKSWFNVLKAFQKREKERKRGRWRSNGGKAEAFSTLSFSLFTHSSPLCRKNIFFSNFFLTFFLSLSHIFRYSFQTESWSNLIAEEIARVGGKGISLRKEVKKSTSYFLSITSSSFLFFLLHKPFSFHSLTPSTFCFSCSFPQNIFLHFILPFYFHPHPFVSTFMGPGNTQTKFRSNWSYLRKKGKGYWRTRREEEREGRKNKKGGRILRYGTDLSFFHPLLYISIFIFILYSSVLTKRFSLFLLPVQRKRCKLWIIEFRNDVRHTMVWWVKRVKEIEHRGRDRT